LKQKQKAGNRPQDIPDGPKKKTQSKTLHRFDPLGILHSAIPTPRPHHRPIQPTRPETARRAAWAPCCARQPPARAARSVFWPPADALSYNRSRPTLHYCKRLKSLRFPPNKLPLLLRRQLRHTPSLVRSERCEDLSTNPEVRMIHVRALQGRGKAKRQCPELMRSHGCSSIEARGRPELARHAECSRTLGMRVFCARLPKGRLSQTSPMTASNHHRSSLRLLFKDSASLAKPFSMPAKTN
jgi:hypothetical protein